MGKRTQTKTQRWIRDCYKMKIEDKHKDKCNNCGSFESKRYSPLSVMRKFYILAVTKSDNSSDPEYGGFTSLLKCPECSLYYLVNLHDSEYPNQENVLLEKYNPKLEEGELIKTINRLEGILSPIEIDGMSVIKSIFNEDRKKESIQDENIN